MGISLVYDVTATFLVNVPGGVPLAGYTTGTPDIQWSASEFAARPGTIRICQDSGATDHTADVLDVESGAATFRDCAPWVEAAQNNYSAGVRPGQRRPAIYCSASNVSDVVNALIAGGVKSGVGLWVANWNLSEATAIADVRAASGPFPIEAIQFTDMGGGGDFDINEFSDEYLSTQSGLSGDTVSEGSSGPAVLAAQNRLNVWSAKIAADGLFGAITFQAVKNFQTEHKLNVDGVVGPITWEALNVSPTEPPPPVTTPTAAPKSLKNAVVSTAASATLSWAPVPGLSPTAGYDVQVEWYKSGFGWVLSVGQTTRSFALAVPLSPRTLYRWRVAANTSEHVWSNWVTFKTA